MIDKTLTDINSGKMAILAAQHIGGLINEMKGKIVHTMSTNYRMGKVDQATLISGIAAFCALEDLENDMRRKILKGQQASNQMNQEQNDGA